MKIRKGFIREFWTKNILSPYSKKDIRRLQPLLYKKTLDQLWPVLIAYELLYVGFFLAAILADGYRHLIFLALCDVIMVALFLYSAWKMREGIWEIRPWIWRAAAAVILMSSMAEGLLGVNGGVFYGSVIVLALTISSSEWKTNGMILGANILFILSGLLINGFQPQIITIGGCLGMTMVGVIFNTSVQRKNLREMMQRQFIERERDTDSLTGLLNKSAFEMTSRYYLGTNNRDAFFIISDLDNFKTINDTFGHAVGDIVLMEIAKAIESTFRSTDVVGRFGGDEFTVLVTNVRDLKVVGNKAQQLLKRISDISIFNILMSQEASQSLTLEQWEMAKAFPMRASIGVSSTQIHSRDYEKLFTNADQALYYVKQHGKNQWHMVVGDQNSGSK